MLPIDNKPTIQYLVEEDVASGIEDIIIITRKNTRDPSKTISISIMNLNIPCEGLERTVTSKKSGNHRPCRHMPRQTETCERLGDTIKCIQKHIGDEQFAAFGPFNHKK